MKPIELPACAAVALLLAVSAAVGEPAATAPRWINGTGVTVRAAPALSAPIVDRLALNTQVERVEAPPVGGYCELQWKRADGTPTRGFTACRYLSDAPTDAQRLGLAMLADGSRNPEYDPARLFWLAPSWAALEAYATHLNDTRLPPVAADEAALQRRDAFVRARDEPLERMKAHLAQGIHGPAARRLVPWDEVQRQARALAAAPRPSPADDLLWSNLGETLGLWTPFANQYQDAAIGARLAAAMVQAIELPTATRSWFVQPGEIATLSDDTAGLSGRFGIVHTYRTQPRRSSSEPGWIIDGLWDIGAVTMALTQPVFRTTIFRNGQLQRSTTHAARTQATWGATDGPMCHDWRPGFAHGDAEASLWAGDVDRAALRFHPVDSLVFIHTRRPLPAGAAPPTVQTVRLDRGSTGFVRATQMHFDLDGDGHPDLVVWEGVGRGPGHLEGETKSDDAWYRLFIVNLAGRWHVLGSDSFSYGCGC